MLVYVDADSVPTAIRAVILRRVTKEGLVSVFVADRNLKDVELARADDTARLRREARDGGVTDKMELRAVKSPLEMVVVPSRDQSADDWIVEHVEVPALCITHDIPLAARLIEKGAVVLDDRGGVFDAGNIGKRLSERAVGMTLREMGVQSEKTRRMDGRQLKAFSDAFDRTLSAMLAKV